MDALADRCPPDQLPDLASGHAVGHVLFTTVGYIGPLGVNTYSRFSCDTSEPDGV